MFLRSLSVVIALAAALSACDTTPSRPTYPELTFTHLPPIRLDVASVEFVDEYIPPMAAPNVEHEFPAAPARAAARWSQDRVRAVGASGLVRVILREASVVEVSLKKTEGFKGAVTTDQSERYDATIVMEIEIRNERGVKDAFVNATAKRSRSVPEDISLNDREKVFFEITEAVMRDIDAQLEKQVDQHFARYRR